MLKFIFDAFLCDNISDQRIFLECKLRHLLARLRYLKCLKVDGVFWKTNYNNLILLTYCWLSPLGKLCLSFRGQQNCKIVSARSAEIFLSLFRGYLNFGKVFHFSLTQYFFFPKKLFRKVPKIQNCSVTKFTEQRTNIHPC